MKKPTLPAAVTTAAKAPALSPEIAAKVQERNKILAWLEQGKAREMELRRELAGLFFPNPKEGTNTLEGSGFTVKLGHTVSRKLDPASLDAVMSQIPESSPARVVGNLISYAPKFSLDVYRTLPEDERRIFDQCLTITEDGAPTLEIILREEIGNPSPAANPAPAPAAATSHSAPNITPTVAASKTKKPAVGSSAKASSKPAPKAKGKPDLKAIFAKPAASKKPAPKKK